MTRREAQAVFDQMGARGLQRLAATLQEQATRLQAEASQTQRHAQWARNVSIHAPRVGARPATDCGKGVTGRNRAGGCPAGDSSE